MPGSGTTCQGGRCGAAGQGAAGSRRTALEFMGRMRLGREEGWLARCRAHLPGGAMWGYWPRSSMAESMLHTLCSTSEKKPLKCKGASEMVQTRLGSLAVKGRMKHNLALFNIGRF